jgi:hypothetical protein
MLPLISFIASVLRDQLRSRLSLQVEILALRHQLAVHQRTCPRPRLHPADRILWTWLSRAWSDWREALVFVKPETVVAWRRRRFREYRARLCRSGKPGRPTVAREVRDLIRRMSSANPLWGAPRIVAELAKIGIDLPKSTVAKCMVRRPDGGMDGSADRRGVPVERSAPIPTPGSRPHLRRALLPSRGGHGHRGSRHRSWVAMAESTRRAAGRQHPQRMSRSPDRAERTALEAHPHLFLDYYHRWRCHQSLDMDCPHGRDVLPTGQGPVVEVGHLGGLHHHYERAAA